MAKGYLSNRQKNLKIGISSYTENSTVLEVTGKVGIGTTNATSNLHVIGDVRVSGVVTATTFSGQVNAGVSTLGITTATSLTAQSINNTGITTTNSLNIGATQVISSARQLQNIASLDATTTATIESAIANAPNTFTDLNVTGISTLGVTSATNLTSQQLNVSGVSTHNNTAFFIPTASGVAGIFSGTTSNDLVRITQLGTGNALVVEDSANPDSSPFVVRGDGNVGLGTSNPTAGILDVRGGTPWFRPNETGADGNALNLGKFSDSESPSYGLWTSDIVGYELEFRSNRFIGNWAFSRNSPIGVHTTIQLYSHYQIGSRISIADTTASVTKIELNEASNTFFNNTGSVLIGTINATGTANQKLQVSGGAYVSTRLGVGQTNPGSALHIGPYNGDNLSHLYLGSGNNAYGWRFDTQDIGNGSVPLRIWRRVNGIDTESITVLNQNGNIGIGTTIPSSNLDIIGNARVSGVVTATTFVGALTGTASSATQLLNARNFSITGSFVTASAISFDGTGNVALAATITPDSIGLGTHTSGDYVRNITGTANQITVTSGTGEGSTPTLTIPNQFTIPQDVTVTRDLQVNRNLNVNGNITIGGSTAFINVQELKVNDPDIVLGLRTDAFGNDISTDNTSNHGGVALASTEGSPLVQLFIAGIETNPATYKKIMWFKAGTFAGLGTDAWLSNYAVGIGSTQFPTGTRLAAGAVQFTERDLAVVRNINSSGVSTLPTLSGTLASYTTGNFTTGNITTGIVTTLTSTNATLTNISSSGISTLGVTSVTTLTVSGVSTVGFLTATNIWNAGITTSSRITLNGANDTATGGGQIYLNGATGNRIDFNQNGVAAPSTGTRSAGTKLVLFPDLSAGVTDYALGIQSLTLWYSVPANNNAYQHRWYGGTTQLADLKGSGELVIGSTSLTGTSNQKLQVSGGAYISTSTGIGKTNPDSLLHIEGSTSGDGGTYNGTNSIVHIKQNTTWGGSQPWALFVEGYSYLNGFRINGSDGQRALFKTSTGSLLGFACVSDDPITFSQNSVTERMRIATGGNVGVGTTNPLALLSVGSKSLADSFVPVQISTQTANSLAYYGANNNGTYGALFGFDRNTYTGAVVRTVGADNIEFVAAGNRSVMITSSNLVGINSTSPTSRLDVVGDAKVSGVVTAAQFSTGASGVGINITTNSITGPSEISIDPAGVNDNTGSVRIKGDLYVDGTQFIVNSTTIELADFNVGIATTVATNSLLDGAGIGIGSTGIRKTITWNNTAGSLTSSEDWNLASGKQYEINGTSVLTSNTLGSGVVNSSLTSVGTLGQLNVSGVSTFAGIATHTAPLFGTQGSFTGVVTATTFIGALTGTATTATNVVGAANRILYNSATNTTTTSSNLSYDGNFVQITRAGDVGLSLRSGNASSTTGLSLGRSGGDLTVAVLGSSGQYANDGAQGDIVFRSEGTGKLLFNRGATNSTLAIDGSNVLVGTVSSTGTASQALQVNSGGYFNGSVGIGTTNPSLKLHVEGTGTEQLWIKNGSAYLYAGHTGDRARIGGWNSSTGATNLVLNDAGGNVGVGTTNPSDKLHVLGGKVRIDSSTNGALEFWSGAGFYGGIGIANALGGSGTDIVLRADATRSLIFHTGGANDRGRINADGVFLVGTANSTGTASQRLQVNSGGYFNGLLGVGKTNPVERIESSGAITVDGQTSANRTSSGSFDYYSTTNGLRLISWGSAGTTGTISFWAGSGGSGAGEKARFDSSGNLLINNTTSTGTASQALQVNSGGYFNGSVGIGTTNPTLSLDVNGAAIVRGTITLPQNTVGVGFGTTTSNPQYAISQTMGDNDGWLIYGESTQTNTGSLVLEVNDDNAEEKIVFRNRRNYSSAVIGVTTFMEMTTASNIIETVPLLIGTRSLTGTASQPLQVSGGAYVSGNLGVGNTNTAYKFEVLGGVSRFAQSGQGDVTISHSNFVSSIKGLTSVQLSLGANNNEVIRINTSGSVGIGTTNPTTNLDVNGSVRLRDRIYDSTNSAGTANYVLASGGPGAPWSWKLVTDTGAGFLDAVFIRVNGNDVGAGGTNTTIDFYSNNLIGTQPTSGIASIRLTDTPTFTNINVSGISTLGVTTATNLTSQQLNVSGISTLGFASVSNLIITGVSTFQDDLNIPTGKILYFGNTQATRIYFGANGKQYFTTVGSQDFNANSITFRNTAESKTHAVFNQDSSVDLYFNNSKKFETTNDGVLVSGLTSTTSLNVSGVSTFNGNVTLGGELRGPSQLIIDPAAVGDNTGSVRIKGDLYVDGTQFIVNSTTIELADFNVGIATTVGTNALLDGAGIGIGSTNIRKTITWNNTAGALTSSEDWNLVSGKQYEINGTSVLSSTTLGSGVVNSSLTSVGTLGQLNVSGVSTFSGTTYINGNLGIGTTNPGANFHIASNAPTILFTENDAAADNKRWQLTANNQEFYLQAQNDTPSGGGNIFKFTRSAEQIQTFEGQNGGNTWFVVNNNTQRVGVGTTNPGSTLDVRSSTGTIRAQNTGNNYSVLVDGNSSGPRVSFGANADSSFMEFGAYSNFNNLDTKARDLKIFSTSAPNALYLQASSGNLGIGTTNATSRLTVWGTNNDTTPILSLLSGNNSTSFNSGAQIAFGYNGSNTYQHFIQTRHNSGNLDNAIDFYVSDGTQNNTLTSGSVQTMSLVSGSVGVGTYTPVSKLDVRGDINVTGIITTTGSGGVGIGSYLRLKATTWTGEGGEAAWEYVNGTTGYYLDVDSGNQFRFANYDTTGVWKFLTNSTEKVRITNGGNVGVGTNNPNALLEVYTANTDANNVNSLVYEGSGAWMRIGDATTARTFTNGVGIKFHDQGSQHYSIGQINGNFLIAQTSANGAQLFPNTTNTTGILLNSSGNVGINTNNPTSTLTNFGSFATGLTANTLAVTNDADGIVRIGTSIISTPTGTSRVNLQDRQGGYLSFYNATSLVGRFAAYTTTDLSLEVGGTERVRFLSNGNIGIGTTTTAYKLEVLGSFAATTKSFVIDHPTKEGMRLRYASLEGPENGVYVRGRTQSSIIELPDYWTGLVDENSITVNLTPIGRKAPLHSVVEISNNTVEIESANDVIDCFYTVFAERKDVEKLEVEI